jgi:hypothetical protein
MKEWRVQMSMKLMLSAAALAALGATSAVAAPAFVAAPYCEQAVSRQACSNHIIYVEQLRARGRRDISLSYMRNLDPRENQALRDAGGGGGGGGGGSGGR